MSFGHGGPSGGPGGSRTPDWAALAEESAAKSRRRKWLTIGGGVLATAAVAAVVATAVVSTGRGDPEAATSASALPGPEELPPESAEPAPSFSSVAPAPPPDPMDFITDEKKDREPVTVEGFFPGRKLTSGDRVHLKGPTARTTQCASAANSALGAVLTRHGCDELIRATYTRDGVAVTVGVAVFSTEAEAKKVVEEATGGMASLSGGGVPAFCRTGVVCRRTTNSYGRYAYFSVTGFTDGRNVTKDDGPVYTAGDDLTNFTFHQIRHRGEVQASAAASAATG
ncbi:hypothetical protein OG233_19090 [Streptomyces sp. NBC_01218]|uniref:hypothetical protein n=1 Tax=Streptomyces sp. NBC_01218 TaxID=2903780 RepID=UPI002E15A4EE|nr:hypothetical protein OG233_19090 [Streptomyces sp. NBC_01218]